MTLVERLRSHSGWLKETVENARFARALHTAGRRQLGLHPAIPDDEADMPWVKFGADHVAALAKDVEEAARALEACEQQTHTPTAAADVFDASLEQRRADYITELRKSTARLADRVGQAEVVPTIGLSAALVAEAEQWLRMEDTFFPVNIGVVADRLTIARHLIRALLGERR